MKPAADVRQSDVTVLEVEAADLEEFLGMFAKVFGFTERNTPPAWLVHLLLEHGGLALGARVGDEPAAFSFSFPAAIDGRAYLSVAGITVAPAFESRGLAARLLERFGAFALDLGYEALRWTADPLGSRALYLHLTKVGGELVAYYPDFYQPFNHLPFVPGGRADAVDIQWVPATDPSRARGGLDGARLITRSEAAGDGVRALIHWDTVDSLSSSSATKAATEIPWDINAFNARRSALAATWRRGVRAAVEALLAAGYRGTGVALLRAELRSFIVFERRVMTRAAPPLPSGARFLGPDQSRPRVTANPAR